MIEQSQLKENIVQAAQNVRANNPMAGSITNTVTIDFVANAQLAAGGSAAMVYLPDEGETLVAAGGAVYLNMGTLFPVYEETIPRTAAAAQAAGKPWVLDPVGIGIGSLRTKLLGQLKEYKPAIVRGNASEIIALAGLWDLSGRHGGSRARCRGGACTLHGRRRCHFGRVRPGHRWKIGGHQPRRQLAYGQGDGLWLFAGWRAGRVRHANRPVHGCGRRGEPLQLLRSRGSSEGGGTGKLQSGVP